MSSGFKWKPVQVLGKDDRGALVVRMEDGRVCMFVCLDEHQLQLLTEDGTCGFAMPDDMAVNQIMMMGGKPYELLRRKLVDLLLLPEEEKH